MESQAKVAETYFLSPEVTAIIELYAQKANISASEALEKMIAQCSQMVVTGVVEEVTEKDVFEDINNELLVIDHRLKEIEQNTRKIENPPLY